jgi:hypothetical protein
LHRGNLEWHYRCTKFHENLPSGSKLLAGDTQTDRQTGDLISLLSFLESRLKTMTTCLLIVVEILSDSNVIQTKAERR